MYPIARSALLPFPLQSFPARSARPDLYGFPKGLDVYDRLSFYVDFGNRDSFLGYGSGLLDLSPSRITGTNTGGFTYVQNVYESIRLTSGQRYSLTTVGFPYGGSLRVSVCAWVLFSNTTGTQTAFIYGNAVNGQAQGLGSSGTSFQYIGGGAINLNGGSITANTWYHLAGTYDGTTYRLYVNGVQIAANNAAGNGAVQAAAIIGNNLALGAPFSGEINEVRVYAKTLSDSEVLGLYYQKASLFGLL